MPTVALTGSTTAAPTFTAPSGTEAVAITLTLTVSDGEASDTDTVTVNVAPANRAPVANAGARPGGRRGRLGDPGRLGELGPGR